MQNSGNPSIITDTPRLLLRALTPEDAAFVLKLTTDAAFITNIGDKGLRNEDDARRFIEEGPWTAQQKPGYGQFAIELKPSGVPAGVCGLLFRENLDVTDVGFALLAEHRGRGYAFEAAYAVMEYGRSKLHLDEIVGLTSRENVSSIRILEKLGMRFDRLVKMGAKSDVLLYR